MSMRTRKLSFLTQSVKPGMYVLHMRGVLEQDRPNSSLILLLSGALYVLVFLGSAQTLHLRPK